MNITNKKLDNPVWHSLNETHQEFSVDYNGMKFYQPVYCSFGGFTIRNHLSEGMSKYAQMVNSFYVVGEMPEFTNGVILKNELVCDQMITRERIKLENRHEITKLVEIHRELLYNLVSLVQPGYFKEHTAYLGNYYGIFENETLVAVTGERMQMNEYIEVSAVVTHPNYTGKGYAKQLVAHTVNGIFDQGKTPYLHVTETNHAAIALYLQLGFESRRKISFWNFHKAG
jgi:predicted GNAT family acetyltransferase